MPDSRPPAVVLLSGGLDSTTCLAVAIAAGFEVTALSFRYGQRHSIELEAAVLAGLEYDVDHHIMDISMGAFGGSSLTDSTMAVPDAGGEGIPSTYVPARNAVFLSCGLALAETIGAEDIFIGVNVMDYSGYPDCRPEFIAAFERMANLATVTGNWKIHTPLIGMNKAQIVELGTRLGVDYSKTISCYRADRSGACGSCDSCALRLNGFARAGLVDPARYQTGE